MINIDSGIKNGKIYIKRGKRMTYKSSGPYKKQIYKTWRNIKARCYFKNMDCYKYYGGRGIKVCDEWLKNFDVFYEWAISNGYKDGLTIDRINSDGDYEPSNCRWADKWLQSVNQRKRVTNSSGYSNIVYSRRKINKWEVLISVHGKRNFLGRYKTQKEALEVLNKYIRDNNLPQKIQEYVGEIGTKTTKG